MLDTYFREVMIALMSDANRLTNRLQEFRESTFLSLSTVAYHVGISRQALAAIEQGKAMPSLITALKLASYYDTSVDTLFDLDWWPNEIF